MAWLGRFDRSVGETALYLERIGCPPEIITRVLQRLQEQHLLDDERFALNRAQAWARRGYGRLRAGADLAARGVDEAQIARALQASFADERERAREIVGRRFPHARADVRERARAARFLLSRGFPEEVVLAILGEGC
ncbi:MAG: recombination regulator RecX [Candidatus Binatia bacterium]|nr:recombination regulator RecX [Candidatus Binatia bacterium]